MTSHQNKFNFLWFLQPTLIALFPAIYILGRSSNKITNLHAFFAISIILICTTLLFFLTSFIYKSYLKGALTTNVLIILFYATKHLVDFILVPISQRFYVFRVRYALIVLTFVCVYFLYKVFKTSIKSTFFLKVAIIPFLILYLLSAYSFFYYRTIFNSVQKKLIAQNISFKKRLSLQAKAIKTKISNTPDIYFIILDAYTSNDILLKNFSYNNQSFTKELTSRGFHVFEKSTSNYPYTNSSLYTTLNMNYLADQKVSPPYLQVLKYNNNVKYFLKNLGYTNIDLAIDHIDLALFQSTNHSDLETERKTIFFLLKQFLLGQFHFTGSFIGAMTPLFFFYSKLQNAVRRKSLLKKLTMFEEIASYQEKPKFVYAHFLIPHPPNIFDENGNPYPAETKDETFFEWNERGYIHAIKFINKKIMHAIDQILKKSARPPIIILQGDHGALCGHRKKEDQLQILNAFYLPNGPKSLPKHIAPINNFRFIFNHYFNTNFPLLAEKNFLASNTIPSYYEEI